MEAVELAAARANAPLSDLADAWIEVSGRLAGDELKGLSAEAAVAAIRADAMDAVDVADGRGRSSFLLCA